MLTFIIPLRAPGSCKNWNKVQKRCVITINNIFGQSCCEFQVILVCNEFDTTLLKGRVDRRLHVERVHYPVPHDHNSRMIDKSSKIRHGLFVARKFAPGTVMFVDADDLVSSRLAQFVKTEVGAGRAKDLAGWYVETGYILRPRSMFAFKIYGFYYNCGTSFLINVTKDDLPVDPEQENYRPIWFVGHDVRKLTMEKYGLAVRPVPFPGAVYSIGTGDNESGAQFWRVLNKKHSNIKSKMMNMRVFLGQKGF